MSQVILYNIATVKVLEIINFFIYIQLKVILDHVTRGTKILLFTELYL